MHGHADHRDQTQFSCHLLFFETRLFEHVLNNKGLVVGGHKAHHPFIHIQGSVLHVIGINGLGGFESNLFALCILIHKPEGADFHPGDLCCDHDEELEDILQVEIGCDGPADIHQGLDILVVSFWCYLFHGFRPGLQEKSLRPKCI